MNLLGGSSGNGWPPPAKLRAVIRLECAAAADDKKSLKNFSAGSRVGDALFLAADERASVDRLVQTGRDSWGDHQRFHLKDLLDLADPEAEADLEGLAADGDWLWVLGSHARTRAKPEKAEDECIDLTVLADLKDTRPRALLARLPLVKGDDGAITPVKKVGKRRAAMVRQTAHGSELAKALKRDALIGPFTRIPAKEGGLDIEGIAVCGNRVALGLRGPVIATHAVLLELQVEAKTSRLHIRGEPVKRLLAMEGLGIRDLKRCGDDLLILAGPTTGLSGPCALYRWRGWVSDPPQHPERVRLHRPERVLELPFGRGEDHPEGLALWSDSQILVIYDSPSKARLGKKAASIDADLFDLPA